MNTHELFELAKERLLVEENSDPENGAVPVMYVEYRDRSGEEHTDMFLFAEFGARTPLEEYKRMFSLGYKWGEENKEAEIDALALIAEAWISTRGKDESQKYRRPHEDPNRHEALVMQHVQVMPTPDGTPDMKQSILQADIIRHGGTLDLGTVDTSEVEIVNLTQPAYFLAGDNASKKTPEEFAQMIGKYL